jgi:hypothetical protein
LKLLLEHATSTGAFFVTEPSSDHGREWSRYMRDPDGYLMRFIRNRLVRVLSVFVLVSSLAIPLAARAGSPADEWVVVEGEVKTAI